jgi:hypothetical protein
MHRSQWDRGHVKRLCLSKVIKIDLKKVYYDRFEPLIIGLACLRVYREPPHFLESNRQSNAYHRKVT